MQYSLNIFVPEAVGSVKDAENNTNREAKDFMPHITLGELEKILALMKRTYMPFATDATPISMLNLSNIQNGLKTNSEKKNLRN